jgi:predicted enzyme related to lactoylglutathione lyase
LENDTVSVRYLVDDVDEAIDFYTNQLGFTVRSNASPAFADLCRGSLCLLLSGATSSAGHPKPDAQGPEPGGWNRIHFVLDDIDAEVARLRDAGATFRNDIAMGPCGSTILLEDPSGNLVELFQPDAPTPANPDVARGRLVRRLQWLRSASRAVR